MNSLKAKATGQCSRTLSMLRSKARAPSCGGIGTKAVMESPQVGVGTTTANLNLWALAQTRVRKYTSGVTLR